MALGINKIGEENAYLNAIKNIPIPTESEIYELGKRNMQGDIEARNKLIESQLRFVATIAAKYKNKTKYLSYIDLIEIGNLGLIHAVDAYDPDKAPLIAFVKPSVNGYIKRGIADLDQDLEKSVYFVDAEKKYRRLISTGEDLSDEEIKRRLEFSDQLYNEIKKTVSRTFSSLNKKINEEDDIEYGESIPSTKDELDNFINNYNDFELLIAIKELIKPFEYFIVYNHILKGECRQIDIGNIFGVTKEAIDNKERVAKQKIKQLLQNDSHRYNKINIIKNREGRNFYKMRIKPITPNDIMLFLYLKDQFDENDQKILYEILLGKYNFNDKELKSYLKISDLSGELRIKRIRLAITRTLNTMEFQNFSSKLCTLYKSKIYKLDLTKNYIETDYTKKLK